MKLLHNFPIFYRLDDKRLRNILEIGNEIGFELGKTVIKQYERSSTIYLILQGGVEVQKNGKQLAKLGVGQFIGEMAFLDDMPTERSADVITIAKTKCLAIPGSSWYSFLEKNPDVAIEVIRSLAARLREVNEALIT